MREISGCGFRLQAWRAYLLPVSDPAAGVLPRERDGDRLLQGGAVMLLNCPHCGGGALENLDAAAVTTMPVICIDCGAHGPNHRMSGANVEDYILGVEAWNVRDREQQARTVLEVFELRVLRYGVAHVGDRWVCSARLLNEVDVSCSGGDLLDAMAQVACVAALE